LKVDGFSIEILTILKSLTLIQDMFFFGLRYLFSIVEGGSPHTNQNPLANQSVFTPICAQTYILGFKVIAHHGTSSSKVYTLWQSNMAIDNPLF